MSCYVCLRPFDNICVCVGWNKPSAFHPDIVFIFCVCVPECVYVHHMHMVPVKARRGRQPPQELEFPFHKAAVTGSVRALCKSSALNWQTISPVLETPA